MSNTQQNTVMKHLRTIGNISGQDMHTQYRISSPTKCISELRKKGYNIKSQWKSHKVTGQRYVRYTLISEE